MSWAPARLGSIGAIGDAALAASCIPAPGEYNDARVICGGMAFDSVPTAMTWPGASMTESVPSVNSVLPDKFFPASFPLWDMGPGPKDYAPAATPAEAKVTGVLGPSTLVAPLPSITPVRAGVVDENAASIGCGIQSWATGNPLLALLAAVGVYFVIRGRR